MKKFLIVDDIKGWQNFHINAVKTILGDNLIIDTADSGMEGYNKILENNTSPYDFIFTDLQMENDFEPKYAGEWFAEQIKSLPNYYITRIVIISATYNIRQIAESLGVFYIPKSVARTTLDAYREVLF